jgi:hypothetical protein
VSASGLIGVCYQQVSAGRHLAGQVVTVRLHPTELQVFFAGQLIRTAPRTRACFPDHLGVGRVWRAAR